MATLIVDSMDREQETFDLLTTNLIPLVEGTCVNTCEVSDTDMKKVEEVLAKTDIEWQWQGPDEDGAEFLDEDDFVNLDELEDE